MIVGSLETFLGQAVDQIVASAMEDASALRFRQGTKKTVLEGF